MTRCLNIAVRNSKGRRPETSLPGSRSARESRREWIGDPIFYFNHRVFISAPHLTGPKKGNQGKQQKSEQENAERPLGGLIHVCWRVSGGGTIEKPQKDEDKDAGDRDVKPDGVSPAGEAAMPLPASTRSEKDGDENQGQSRHRKHHMGD